MSQCSKNINDTLSHALCITFFFLSHFVVIYDLLLTHTWQHGIYLSNIHHYKFYVNFY